MVGLLVVSHGRLAEELVNATRTIVGEVEAFEAVSIGWDDDVDASTRKIEQALTKVDHGDGALVLTDMFGGTPTNLGLSLYEEGKIEIVTGVNLPMLIKFANLRGQGTLADIANRIAEQGRGAIHVASHFLGADRPGAKETEV